MSKKLIMLSIIAFLSFFVKDDVGIDYIGTSGAIVIDRKNSLRNNQVGFFNLHGGFSDKIGCYIPYSWREATEEEVVEAFKKELVRRYGEDWENVKIKSNELGEYYVNNINTEIYNTKIKKL